MSTVSLSGCTAVAAVAAAVAVVSLTMHAIVQVTTVSEMGALVAFSTDARRSTSEV